jgi:hypothetical protein
MTKKNARSLDAIATEIHALERKNIFVIGALLIEAKNSCEHGEWLDWLAREFRYSADTAERTMKVADLATKFRKLRNLKLAKTTLYALTEEAEADLPDIIDALAKCTAKQKLAAAEAAEIIALVRTRRGVGELPDEVLRAVADHLDRWGYCPEGRQQVIDAVKQAQPTTVEQVQQILNPVKDDGDDTDDGDDDGDDADDSGAADDATDHGNAGDSSGGDADGDDDGGDDHQDDDAQPLSGQVISRRTLEPELIAALNVVLHYARRCPPRTVAGITGPELSEIGQFIETLHKIMSGGDAAKRAADRAEASARRRAA